MAEGGVSYLDAIYLKLRPDDEPAEGVPVAWGLTLQGQKVLLGLQLGSRECYESRLAIPANMDDIGKADASTSSGSTGRGRA